MRKIILVVFALSASSTAMGNQVDFFTDDGMQPLPGELLYAGSGTFSPFTARAQPPAPALSTIAG
jgi:hypothetical protein